MSTTEPSHPASNVGSIPELADNWKSLDRAENEPATFQRINDFFPPVIFSVTFTDLLGSSVRLGAADSG